MIIFGSLFSLLLFGVSIVHCISDHLVDFFRVYVCFVFILFFCIVFSVDVSSGVLYLFIIPWSDAKYLHAFFFFFLPLK